jgi:DNA (cytosine-5)-methyltransferase 1
MNELVLFAGAGGGILGSSLLGWRTVAAVEIEEYPRAVLLQRQADGILPRFPTWDDVRTFDGNPWRGRVDIITGGFPCQDISAAGKGAGITGSRSGLWSEMARIIGEVRPRFVLVENSPLLVSRGLDTVLSDLAALGFDAEWGIIGADEAGAPHRRKRIWILAYSNAIRRDGRPGKQWKVRREEPTHCCEICDSMRPGLQTQRTEQQTAGLTGTNPRITWWDIDPADLPDTDSYGPRGKGRDEAKQGGNGENYRISERNNYWPAQSRVGRVAHGVANRVDCVKSIGNGQVPAVVVLAWETLSERIWRGT